MQMILGSIEAGGTKFVCGIGNEQGEVLERISIPTKTPDETIPEVIEFLKNEKWRPSELARLVLLM